MPIKHNRPLNLSLQITLSMCIIIKPFIAFQNRFSFFVKVGLTINGFDAEHCEHALISKQWVFQELCDHLITEVDPPPPLLPWALLYFNPAYCVRPYFGLAYCVPFNNKTPFFAFSFLNMKKKKTVCGMHRHADLDKR